MREITERPSPGRFLNPFEAMGNLWKNRELLGMLARRNIEGHYRGSIMGIVWMVLTPLLMLAVYAFVFGLVFGSHWGDDLGGSKAAFALVMFCGMVVFNVFSESVGAAVNVITMNPNYVKKAVFPLEALPAASVLSASFIGLVWTGILMAGIGLFLRRICPQAVCLPLVFLPLILFSSGTAWLVASLGVFVRDLPHVINVVLRALFFMTPVCYALEKVPEPYSFFLLLNPLTTFVQEARLILIYGRWPDWGALGAVTGVSLAVFQIGYFWFMKTKRGFADVL